MDMIKISLGGDEYEFPRYRAADIFESFSDYMVNCLLGVYTGPRADIVTTRCLLSGFPVAVLVDSEVEQMIVQAVRANRLERLENTVALGDSDHQAAFTLVWDHIARRMIDSSKAAPSVSFSRDRLSLVAQPWDRQLSILMGMLLFDAGQLRDKAPDYETWHARVVAMQDLADMIQLIDSYDMVDKLHHALIELDALYAIKALQLTRKEREALEGFRTAEYIDFDAFHQFVLRVIAHRDVHGEVAPDEEVLGWTRAVYTNRAFQAVDRLAYSNIWKAEAAGSKPKVAVNRDGTKVKKPVGRPRKPLTQEQQEKAARKETVLSSFDRIFGAANLGNLGKK